MNWAYRSNNSERVESFPTEWALSTSQPKGEERRPPPAKDLSSHSEPTRALLDPLPDTSAA
jgi:hypothetical protein